MAPRKAFIDHLRKVPLFSGCTSRELGRIGHADTLVIGPVRLEGEGRVARADRLDEAAMLRRRYAALGLEIGPAAAERQQAVLRAAVDGLRDFRGTLRHLAAADIMGYGHCEKIYALGGRIPGR